MTEFEVMRIAKEAARETVREMFLALGVDVSTPGAVIDLQQDFAHLRKSRTAVAAMRLKALTTGVGIAVTVALGVWFGIGHH